MKKILTKNNIILILFSLLLLVTNDRVESSELCTEKGYTIISINGVLTNAEVAIENKEKIKKSLFSKYQGQEVFIDYVYNPTHGTISDLVDSALQKTSEKSFVSDTRDLKNMIIDLSKKVKTQKLLFIAHSQGNLYSNDIYNTLGNKEGGVSKSSMGIYGIATPTSYIAGGGKYILSKNDSLINKIRARGIVDVLPANVDILSDPEDKSNGHGLVDVYLKHQNKRISAEVMTMLHSLKEDLKQDQNKVCIDTPELTFLDEVIDVAYRMIDPVQESIEGKIKFVVNGLVKPVFNTVAKLGKGYMKFVNSMFATAGTSFQSTQNNGYDQNEKYAKDEEYYDDEYLDEVEYEEENDQEEEQLFAYENKKDLDYVIKRTEVNPEVIESVKPNKYYSNHQRNTTSGGSSSSDENSSNDDVGNNDIGNNENNNNGNNNTPAEDENQNPNTNPEGNVPPVIFLTGDENIKISNGSDYLELGATANDSNNTPLEVVISGHVDTNKNGVYTISYKATDSKGNQSIKERTVEVYTPLLGFFIDENTELPAGEYFFENVTITNNAILTLLSDKESTTSNFRGVKINATNLTIDSGATITADNTGFTIGPGTTTENRAGGSYGGKGEWSEEKYIYGSSIYPKDLGSAGAMLYDYYKGGGAIWIEVSDTLINNGIVSASGWASSSGGSIYVNTENLAGSGVFKANGGGLGTTSVFYGPGGGGRTAIHYNESSFTGEVEARAGSGHIGYPDLDTGEAGTAGMFDKKNNVLYVNNDWEFILEDSPFIIDKMVVSNMSKVRFQEGAEIEIGELILDDSSELILTGEEEMSIGNLRLLNSSWVSIPEEKILKLDVDNLYISEYSKISAQAKGYSTGPGTPEVDNWGKAGSSYGGKGGGGASSKPTYGDKNAPLDFGSGTEGFRGGGAIQLKIKNTLVNDGLIIAEGYWYRTSGGSIYIETNQLEGTGQIHAKGSNATWAGQDSVDIAGGGGRIAVYYNENNFSGEISANAGNYCYYGCAPGGENGTIVLVDMDETVFVDEVLSSENLILSFSFEELTPRVEGLINNENSLIVATVPSTVDITSLIPLINISSLSSIDKDLLTPQDFSNPITYTVTAENGQTKSYTVTINKEELVEIPADVIPPIITMYSINGSTEDVEINPVQNNLEIIIESSESVNWLSIYVEKIDNSKIKKVFRSGSGCEDWTGVCKKLWDGTLSGEGLVLENGDYQVRVHIEDLAKNDTTYILPAIIKVRGI